MESNAITELTAAVVSAYVSNNSVAASNLAKLVGDIHLAFDRLSRGEPAVEVEPQKPEPAVPVRKSITPDFLISLEDGKKYKSLKRHLRTSHNMSPAEYRAKWDLADDYPMVAPNYAKVRSELAKTLGLGKDMVARRPSRKK